MNAPYLIANCDALSVAQFALQITIRIIVGVVVKGAAAAAVATVVAARCRRSRLQSSIGCGRRRRRCILGGECVRLVRGVLVGDVHAVQLLGH